MSITNITLFITTIALSLIAGLFYAYSCSVNPGLKRLSDAEYISAMQSINIAIQNPIFFFSFLGSVLLLPLSAYLNYQTPQSTRFLLLVAASVIYIGGAFGVTIFGNVPLNEKLALFDLKNASQQAIVAARDQFEQGWNNLHLIRTIASIISLGLIILACLNPADLTKHN